MKTVSVKRSSKSFLSATALAVAVSLMTPLHSSAWGEVEGVVVDRNTGLPVAGAIVTCGAKVATTEKTGRFSVEGCGDKLLARAPGYGRTEAPAGASPVIKLPPLTPKALYLSVYGIGNRKLRDRAKSLMGTRGLNALVIDVKGDRGLVPYPSSVALASAIGARKVTTVKDLRGLVGELKKEGIYTIARIVVFKDDPLARARPALAVRNARGGLWKDREGLAWCDPFRSEVWGYDLAVAEEAARSGFDEIQFDYVRFPDGRGVVFSRPNTERNRIAAITGFLKEARTRLRPYNVFLSADIFGYVSWNLNDTEIGQRIEDVAPLLDYICPMLYPSGFQFGIPGYRNPVAHPHEIVSLSLREAMKRTGLPGVRFRPWLQAFRDYAFDRRPFSGQAIGTQIKAAEQLGTAGWMLWNPRNVYDQVKPAGS